MEYSEEVKSISNILNLKNRIAAFVRYNKDICNNIIKETNFLDNDFTISERIYFIINNIFEPIYCKVCKINQIRIKGKNQELIVHVNVII